MTNQQILDKMAEQFMEPQVTKRMKWMQLDTPNDGIVSVPATDFSAEQFAEQYSMDATEVEFVTGHGARLSAPGFLDCTEWTVFPTAEEAEQYLVDQYGDDIEEDADDEDAEQENAQ